MNNESKDKLFERFLCSIFCNLILIYFNNYSLTKVNKMTNIP